MGKDNAVKNTVNYRIKKGVFMDDFFENLDMTSDEVENANAEFILNAFRYFCEEIDNQPSKPILAKAVDPKRFKELTFCVTTLMQVKDELGSGVTIKVNPYLSLDCWEVEIATEYFVTNNTKALAKAISVSDSVEIIQKTDGLTHISFTFGNFYIGIE